MLKNILCVGSTSALTQTKALVLNKPPSLEVCPTLLSRAQCSNTSQLNMPIKWKGITQSDYVVVCQPLDIFLCVIFHEHMHYALFYLLKLQRLPSNPLLLDTAGSVAMAADSHSFSFHLHCKALLSLLWHEKWTVHVCEMGIFCEIMWAFVAKILTFSMCIMNPCDAPQSHKLKWDCSVWVWTLYNPYPLVCSFP